MKTEILIGILMNLKGAAGFFTLIFGVLLVVGFFAKLICEDGVRKYTKRNMADNAKGERRDWYLDEIEEHTFYLNMWSRIFTTALFVFVMLFPIAMLPKIQDIWEIRIALVKLELASPENIKQSTEEIGRIAKKLECKYLGCDEAKK